jgi:hypothetical protein
MSKKLRLALSELLRTYTRLRQNHFHLMGIMLTAQQEGKAPPDDWLEQLEALRHTPHALAEIADSEETLALVLQTADEEALAELILSVVKNEPLPN